MSSFCDIKEVKQTDLIFKIRQDNNFLIITCSHTLGVEVLKDYYKNNRFFRTALIIARVKDINLRSDYFWLVEYDEFESCQHAKIAKRELVELHPYFYHDKIILSKFKLKF